jgi:hypothetical protein
MGNLALVLTILFGHGIKRLFIGQLREIEIEVRLNALGVRPSINLLVLASYRPDMGNSDGHATGNDDLPQRIQRFVRCFFHRPLVLEDLSLGRSRSRRICMFHCISDSVSNFSI